jgi:hypothetical protein
VSVAKKAPRVRSALPAKDAYIRTMVVAGRGISSWAIEWWGGGGWSHYANIMPDGSIIDARSDWITKPDGDPYLGTDGRPIPPGVQIRPAGYLDSEPKWVVVDVPCTSAQARDWEALLRSPRMLGKPYDFRGIGDFVTGSLKDRNWRDESAWFCSEAGMFAKEEVSIAPRLAAPVFRIDPGEALMIDMALAGKIVASKGLTAQ